MQISLIPFLGVAEVDIITILPEWIGYFLRSMSIASSTEHAYLRLIMLSLSAFPRCPFLCYPAPPPWRLFHMSGLHPLALRSTCWTIVRMSLMSCFAKCVKTACSFCFNSVHPNLRFVFVFFKMGPGRFELPTSGFHINFRKSLL